MLSHFPNLLDMSFSFVLYSLRVLSLKINLCSVLKFCPVFLGNVKYKIVLAIYSGKSDAVKLFII